MSTKWAGAAWLGAGLLAGLLARPALALEPAHLVAKLPRILGVLETRGPRCLLVLVYLAETREQKSKGLMFVERLEDWEGMYFPNGYPAKLTMWMANTPLSLDMLFLQKDGKVSHINRDTVPFSRALIHSGEWCSGYWN